MTIHILRGQHQIGGSVIEVSTDTTRVILDVGVELDEGPDAEVPPIDGLFHGKKACDAVFISHYHADHIGLLSHVVDGIPLYMGERAYRIVRAANEFKGCTTLFTPQFLYDRVPTKIGDLTITPFLCDHSAFDAYMLLLEADGKKVLYTGDFRANGRQDYESLLRALPQVDALIVEGTTLSREDCCENLQEELLEDIAVNYLSKHSGPAFLMLSAMNIDRLVTGYQIAQRTGRLFLEDLYTAGVATAAGTDIPQPNGVHSARVFMTGGDRQYELLRRYGNAKIGKNAIAKAPFLMCVRSSMQRYLEKLSEVCSFEGGVLFYGMWKGYLEQPAMKEFIHFMESKGVKLHVLHTSGHADSITIDRLIQDVHPQLILPVHTEQEHWFDRYQDTSRVVYSDEPVTV